MSDAFYSCLHTICYPIMWMASRAVVLHGDRVPKRGPVIVAANHLSPYDVPGLMYASPRPLDFVSVTEVFENKFTAWLYGSMNAFPLDRHHPDAPTVRTLLHRLEQGRAVAMFPEGQIRTPERSLLNGGPFKPGVAGIARLAGAAVVPCVIVGTSGFGPVKSFLPLRTVRWGAAFGEPVTVTPDGEEEVAQAACVAAMRRTYDALHAELRESMETP